MRRMRFRAASYEKAVAPVVRVRVGEALYCHTRVSNGMTSRAIRRPLAMYVNEPRKQEAYKAQQQTPR